MNQFIETRRKELPPGTVVLLDGGYSMGWHSFSISFWKGDKWIRTENYRKRTEKEKQSLFKRAKF